MPSAVIVSLDPSEVGVCARMMASADPWITFGVTEAEAESRLSDPAREVYAVHDDGGVSGFLVLDMRRALLTGYIQSLCVREDRRGQGVGTSLLAFAEERIFRESPNAFICVSSFNSSARRLYERSGFELVGTLCDYVVPGHDELLFRKTKGSWQTYR